MILFDGQPPLGFEPERSSVRNATPEKDKFYVRSENTLDAWTGSEYFKYLFKIELFGFRIVLWKHVEEH